MHKLYILLTQCIQVFIWISEQTVIISLYSVRRIFKYNAG